MQTLYERKAKEKIQRRLGQMPCVAILGPRQCGKTTIAKTIIAEHADAIYIDLETPSHREQLRDPELFFKLNKDKLICLDEIQHMPEIFAIMRGVIDSRKRNSQFLVLGSASKDLIKQSTETLAGRIAYIELTPFTLQEVPNPIAVEESLWIRGGFPRSYLAENTESSTEWRDDFIQTYLQRDLPVLGFSIPEKTLSRLWTMLAHMHGGFINYSSLGNALGISHNTVRNYVDILEQTYMLRVLRPFHGNTKKRLTKSPKVYVRDSGILHSLLKIQDKNELLAHPVIGNSWEGFVIEQVLAALPSWEPSVYSTSSGAEIDLVLEKGQRRIAIECKSSTTPRLRAGFFHAIKDIGAKESLLIAPIQTDYPYKENVMVKSLYSALSYLETHYAQSP